MVFAFEESRLQPVPETIALVLVSKSEAADTQVHADLLAVLGDRKMALLAADQLAVISAASPEAHPIREILDIELDTALEEAATGSVEAARKLAARPSYRRMSAEALAKARAKAEANGRDGEALINLLLQRRLAGGEIQSFVWVAEANAISPWDFEYVDAQGTTIRVEVKSTGGGFDRAIHISQNEVMTAAEPGAPRTDIYRVFALGDDGGWLRCTKDIASFCRAICDAAKGFGTGVTPDGYSIDVARLTNWTDAKRLTYDEVDDDV